MRWRIRLASRYFAHHVADAADFFALTSRRRRRSTNLANDSFINSDNEYRDRIRTSNNIAVQDVPILNSDITSRAWKRDDTLVVPSRGRYRAGDLLHLVGQSTATCITRNWSAKSGHPRCRRAARIYVSGVWSSPTKVLGKRIRDLL